MQTSVIVSTYNSPVWLEKVLLGYASQRADGFEVVVADDGSGPETEAVVARFAGHPRFRLRHVWHEDQGFRKCAILNRGIEACHGDYLVFTDGDCIPHPDFVATHQRLAEKGRFLTGTCCRLPMDLSRTISEEDITSGRLFRPGWLLRHGFLRTSLLRRTLALGLGFNRPLDQRSTRPKRSFHGNNASCARADALAVGGFDTRIGYGGEDREFGYRLEHLGLRAKIVRHSALTAHLDHARGYRDKAVRAANLRIIEETRTTRRVRTSSGIETSGFRRHAQET